MNKMKYVWDFHMDSWDQERTDALAATLIEGGILEDEEVNAGGKTYYMDGNFEIREKDEGSDYSDFDDVVGRLTEE